MSRFVPPTEHAAPATPPPDMALAKWRHLTECLIFAAPYGMAECLRHLDAQQRPYNRDMAIIRCKALSEAINEEFSHLEHRLLRCHAANDSPTFRGRYAHLLPKRPRQQSQAERRTGVPDAQREREADEVASCL
jgi:hypothetical protein